MSSSPLDSTYGVWLVSLFPETILYHIWHGSPSSLDLLLWASNRFSTHQVLIVLALCSAYMSVTILSCVFPLQYDVSYSATRYTGGGCSGGCNRWERLTLNKIIWDVAAPDIRRVLSGIRGRLSLLRRLEISCFGPDSSGIGDIFAAAPQLQQVLLMDAGRLSLPWPQLTHFRGRFSANEYLEILRKAHNLIDCGIDLVDDELPPATPVAVLPHLRRVFAWGTRFFQFLEAPNLEYLRVNGEVLAILPLFLHRSGCQLKRLTLRHCVISLPSLISLLRHAPALSHFEVHFGYHEDEHAWVFCALKVSGIATDLCPHLTSLWIICDFNPTAEEYDSLCEMVKSRWNVGRWLKSVRVWLDQSVPRSVLDRFEALRGDGLNVLLLDFEGHKLINN
ncbi:hypothetical protein B0H13DRAFT_2401834 [Mycena leptocephala]|nr:hypothetical protein B0H13DRAFT_2401834 [Mycena leptocephala]